MNKKLMDMTLGEIAAEAKRNIYAFFDGDAKELVFPEDSTMCHICKAAGFDQPLKREIFEDPDKTRSYLACKRCGFVVEEEPLTEVDDDSDGSSYYV